MQFTANHIQIGSAVFAGAGSGHGSAQGLRHGLKPIADAEHRQPQVEHPRIELGGAVGVDTGRPAGQHDRLRVFGLDLLQRGGMRDHLGEDPGLPDTTRDQLRVLGAEIDHQDGARRS